MLVGYHISKTNLDQSIKTAIEDKATAIQLFISSPKIWQVSNLKKEEIEIIKTYQKLNNYVVIHGKYLYNFCRTNEAQSNALIRELEEANKISCNVIIHQGKNVKDLSLTNEEAVIAYVNNIKKILDSTIKLENKPKIILENSAHQGNEIGYSIIELANIWNMFDNNYKKRLGICIDLCHIFVAGECDIRSIDSIKKFFKDFKKLIGLENLTVIHFNDSSIKYNGHNDHHQDLTVGYISNSKLGGSLEGFKFFIKKAKKLNIPLILETPATSITYKDQIDFILQNN
jgi:apurinic endonuclease APN1